MKTKLAAAAVGTALLITPAAPLAGTSSNSPTTMKGSVSAQATVNRQIPLTPRPAVHRAHGSAQYQAQRASEFQVKIEKLASLGRRAPLARRSWGVPWV
jgi:hypothetical protein